MFHVKRTTEMLFSDIFLFRNLNLCKLHLPSTRCLYRDDGRKRKKNVFPSCDSTNIRIIRSVPSSSRVTYGVVNETGTT